MYVKFSCNIFLLYLIEELPGLAYRLPAYWMFFFKFAIGRWKKEKNKEKRRKYKEKKISSNIYFGLLSELLRANPSPLTNYYFQILSEFLRANPSPLTSHTGFSRRNNDTKKKACKWLTHKKMSYKLLFSNIKWVFKGKPKPVY